MAIKGLNKNFRTRHHYRSGFLDKHIAVKDIFKYGGYVLLGLALLVIIIIIPFMLGRTSINCAAVAEDTTDKTEKVNTATSLINGAAVRSENESGTTEEEINSTEEESQTNESNEESDEEDESEEDIDEPEETELIEEEYDETARYLRTDPRVATTYNDVDTDLLDFEYELRGADWGTINKLKVIITNNQDKIVIPYTLKVKIYNAGEHASEWWDEEVNLRDHLNIIAPDGYKIIELDTHISFSEINEKKRVSIHLFDEVGKAMGSRVKEIEIEE